MKAMTLEEVVTALEGTADRSLPVGTVSRVTIDSRAVSPGDLFVAVRGLQFDGHDFVGEAFARGAMAAVVRDDYHLPRMDYSAVRPGAGSVVPVEDRPGHGAGGSGQGVDRRPLTGSEVGGYASPAMLIRVDDPVQALGRLARYYRRSVIEGSVAVVAVTGSNGKTTTKAMIAHVLGGRYKGRASIKSYNNAIGVPLTLLSTEPPDEFVVCEVGTNAPGEIAALARLIEPEVAVLTGIAEVHLEGLGSLEGVAAEKLSLLAALRPDGFAVVNVDPELLRWSLEHDRQYMRIKRVTFGEWSGADLRLTSLRHVAGASGTAAGLEFTVNDRFEYQLGIPGRHNAFNALAAIGVARRFGMDHEEIAARLATFELPPMRLQGERLGKLTLINDAYNANPASVQAAMEVLVSMPAAGRRVMILGDMRELGAAAADRHRAVAERLAASGVDLVIAVGEHSKLVSRTVQQASGGRVRVHAYASTALARRRLVSHLEPTDTVLVKGSRLLALEQLVEVIRGWASSPPERKPAGKKKVAAKRSVSRGRVRGK
ncbi:MAG: UDP-N-acetylmuramoyl-tripeptide--D-alanyl-D-alanine ligase [Phycisphaerae bacterium]|nr:UDP-N-acetylmuramoyl-tripeptide--D-alanyl-D-alanine ligase [Phycisphaerae bacterium]